MGNSMHRIHRSWTIAGPVHESNVDWSATGLAHRRWAAHTFWGLGAHRGVLERERRSRGFSSMTTRRGGVTDLGRRQRWKPTGGALHWGRCMSEEVVKMETGKSAVGSGRGVTTFYRGWTVGRHTVQELASGECTFKVSVVTGRRRVGAQFHEGERRRWC
jgi:hypothetical protein